MKMVQKGRVEMPSQLFFVNIPYNCSDRELKEWIESRGIDTESIRIVRDLVAGVSPAFAYAALKDHTRLEEAVCALNGKKMRNQTITVKQAPVRRAMDQASGFYMVLGKLICAFVPAERAILGLPSFDQLPAAASIPYQEMTCDGK